MFRAAAAHGVQLLPPGTPSSTLRGGVGAAGGAPHGLSSASPMVDSDSMRRSSMRWLSLFSLALASCGGSAPSSECTSNEQCGAGMLCLDGACAPRPDAAPPRLDGAPSVDAGCRCGPGELCRAGGCERDCGDPSSEPCAEGDGCDFATGACVTAGTSGILTGEGERCGEGGPLCLPGTECSPSGACVPAPPCASAGCTADRSVCWGRSCRSERPAGLCAPASLERMNEDDFVRGGDGGAFDLEFDDACNAYTVTMISGPDYLRQLAPDGTLTVWTGVTNLNMGEVAVRRLPGDEFGMGDGLGQVALTYVCCATCGCVSGDPQGVARLEREAPPHLPMVITATPSQGTGPFQRPELDTGPYGLTWGRDNTLFVGNVATSGDLVRADLDAGTTMEIHRFDARIHASATFGQASLLVAVEGGTVYLTGTAGGAPRVWAEVGEDVTSLVRDPFTGRVYVSVTSARVLEYDARGALLGVFAEPGARGRLAYAPDGYLYYLVSGWPTRGEVLRYPLPPTL